jgi:hypothetical protein
VTIFNTPNFFDTLSKGLFENVTSNLSMLGASVDTYYVVPSSPILFILTVEDIYCSETSVVTTAMLRHIPEDCILHSYSRENLKSYIALNGWTL